MDRAAYESFARNERDHFWFRGRRAIFFDVIRRHVGPPREGARVFDLGCGVGGMLGPMSEWGEPMGMDVDRDSLKFCRDRGHTAVFEGRGHRLPVATGSVDLVGAFDVLEHIPEERETLDECLRILKPGGWLFISGPAYQFLYTHQDRMVDHQRRYRVSELKRKCRDAGFEVVKGSYINFFLFPLIFCVLMLKKVREKISPPSDEETRFNTEIAMPGFVNGFFGWLFSLERYILRVMSIPTGHSLIVLARKPGASCGRPGAGGPPNQGEGA